MAINWSNIKDWSIQVFEFAIVLLINEFFFRFIYKKVILHYFDIFWWHSDLSEQIVAICFALSFILQAFVVFRVCNT